MREDPDLLRINLLMSGVTFCMILAGIWPYATTVANTLNKGFRHPERTDYLEIAKDTLPLFLCAGGLGISLAEIAINYMQLRGQGATLFFNPPPRPQQRQLRQRPPRNIG